MEWIGRSGQAPVLALDTSTHIASVAVLGPTCDLTAEGSSAARSDDLIPLIDRVLADAGVGLRDLAAIAVGAGPGSFTGLRIGMATAKGLCFARGLPLWTASSLAALALDAAAVEPLDDALVVPVFDARRGEVGCGFFRVDGERVASLAEDRVADPAALVGIVSDLCREHGLARAVMVGEALASHGPALAPVGRALGEARATPSARSIARLAIAETPEDSLRSGAPIYIRPSAAEVAFPEGNPGRRIDIPTDKS